MPFSSAGFLIALTSSTGEPRRAASGCDRSRLQEERHTRYQPFFRRYPIEDGLIGRGDRPDLRDTTRTCQCIQIGEKRRVRTESDTVQLCRSSRVELTDVHPQSGTLICIDHRVSLRTRTRGLKRRACVRITLKNGL